jgi:hypothetical protein
MKCKCSPLSPFLWHQQTTPSIFANDPLFKGKGDHSLSAGHIMTEVVKKKRKQNENHGTIYGLNKDREEAMLKAKRFHVYSKAGAK